MKKKWLAAFAFVGAFALLLTAATAPAQDKAEPGKKEKAGPALKVGDKAPGLTATKWLQGSEVKQFEKGKIYVVEFWATWCGPCIVMMPHMAEMQAQFKDQGVTFIGFSAKDPNNSEEKVVKFVEKRGPKLKYTFVYADNRKTNEDWMTAAGRNGIPCAFVVDRDSKIAYVGHPMYLDLVLPKVAAGTWKADADLAVLEKVEGEVNEAFKALGSPDSDAALKTIAEFENKYPPLAHLPYFIGPKLNLMLKSKKYDEAQKMADDVIARALKQEDPTAFRTVASVLRSPLAKSNKQIVMLSLKAAETGLKVAGSNDPLALLDVASSYFALEDNKKVVAFGTKALAAAESDPTTFRTVASVLRTSLAKGNKEVLAMSLKSAESGLKRAGEKSAMAILNVADSHFALGDTETALDFGAKAVAAAESESPALRRAIEMQVKNYEAKKKASPKDGE